MSSRAVRTGPARSGDIRPLTPASAGISLFPTAARQLNAPPAVEPRELWVGVHLPRLPVEALGQPSGNTPRAVVEMQGQTQFIAALCERAELFGVRPGMSLAAALALIPHLETKPKDSAREKQLLERLATQAQRFTPRVSLVPPDGLLLEVKGSLHLFGGAKALCHALEEQCRVAGVRPFLALTPVPFAALACARAGRNCLITEPAHLIGQLAALPLITLRWPTEVLDRLTQIGVHTIGEAARLPRAGFARRFGKLQLAMLDRVTGRHADLRIRFQARERFRRRHPLLYDLEHHEALLTTIEPLLQELGAFLKARQCGITRLECLLEYRHSPVTRCVLRLAAPAASARHLSKLLGERLAALSLPEPVRALELRSGGLVSRAPIADSLWQPGEHGGGLCAESPELIEHLRARLGHEAVYGLQMLSSHRPETAWATTEPMAAKPSLTELAATRSTAESRLAAQSGVTQPALDTSLVSPWPAFRRPVWLLPTPQRLREHDGLPRRCGPLRLLGSAERIETGWWDRGDIARDYYTAVDLYGVRLWIFRERTAPHRWFLQGIFG
jgi:protein ImuB